MSTVASIRPGEWNVPLFLHVFGAMLLVGATLSGASALAFARGDTRMLRVGYWTLLLVGFPAYFVMRVGAEWLADKEGFAEEGASEAGLDQHRVDRRRHRIARVRHRPPPRRRRRLSAPQRERRGFPQGDTGALCVVLLAAYVVAIWAMAGKPD